jgi:hypothetical protein
VPGERVVRLRKSGLGLLVELDLVFMPLVAPPVLELPGHELWTKATFRPMP